MVTTFVGRESLLPGTKHLSFQENSLPEGPAWLISSMKNRQDQLFSHFFMMKGEMAVAVFQADGGSEGLNSETVSGLITQMGAIQLALLIKQYGISDPARLGFRMYEWVVTTLTNMIEQHPYGNEYLYLLRQNLSENWVDSNPAMRSVYDYVTNNFLFTMNLLYAGPNATLTYQRGDGGFFVDGAWYTTDQGGVPKYVAYEFFPQFKLDEGEVRLREEGKTDLAIPKAGFDCNVYGPAQRVAVYSDGFPTQWLGEEKLWQCLAEPQNWGKRNKLDALLRGRWAESITNPQLKELLKDDSSVAMFERRTTQVEQVTDYQTAETTS